ncbi:hypothetical protein lbkm_2277 [Lachnospiraceae bacterium KM106-2]|nr:hypothetical protein lbkm_2277 [Lachnospiraceae bacterium KM106-2]
MEIKKCLEILRTIKDVAFATVDDKGKPQIRIIDVMLVENETLYFCTARGKNFYQELLARPWVAITGLNKEYQMVRLSGEVKKLSNQKKWIDRIFEENPSMKGVYPGESRYILEPFCIDKGEIEFFDLGRSPIYRKSFVMGNEKKEEKGFHITEQCIGCSQCKKACPSQCIEVGNPYKIQQENCLHCGMCLEQCPVHAIERYGE